MLAGRTPGAPQAAREDAAFDSAFPFERQGRLLRSRSISGLFSRSLHSGLQPPCLRFAVAVTGTPRKTRYGCSLGFAAAVIADGRLQRACKAQRSSNRTCRSPASGSPTGFTARYTETHEPHAASAQ